MLLRRKSIELNQNHKTLRLNLRKALNTARIFLNSMVGENGYFVTEKVKEMIRKYADKPESFFKENGKVNEEYLDKMIEKWIDINPNICFGRARIKDIRITVCDIITDTHGMEAPKQYVLEKMYAPPFPKEGIDAAYAFLMKNLKKVEEDFQSCFGHIPPKDLYA